MGNDAFFAALKKNLDMAIDSEILSCPLSKISKHILFQVLQKYVHTMYIETLLLGFRIRMAEFQR